MKKIISLGAIALILTFNACQKENVVNPSNIDKVSDSNNNSSSKKVFINEFDIVGQIHDAVFQSVASNPDVSDLSTDQIFSQTKLIVARDGGKQLSAAVNGLNEADIIAILDGEITNTVLNKTFGEVISTSFANGEITSKEKQILLNLNNIFENPSTPATVHTRVEQLEKNVIVRNDMTLLEKRRVLVVLSVARHSLRFWEVETNNPNTNFRFGDDVIGVGGEVQLFGFLAVAIKDVIGAFTGYEIIGDNCSSIFPDNPTLCCVGGAIAGAVQGSFLLG